MADKTLNNVKIQIRRDTSTNLNNVVPAIGEPLYDTSKKKLVVGDGINKYEDLSHIEPIRFYNNLEGTAAVTSKPYFCSKWDISDESFPNLYSGLRIIVKVPVAGNGSYGTGISINGGDYHPVVYNANSMISTRYSVNSYVELTYDAVQTGTLYLGNDSQTITGCWKVMDYDTTNIYQLKKNNSLYKGTTVCYRYRLLFTNMGGDKLIPINNSTSTSTTGTKNAPTTAKFNPFGPIFEYHTSTAYTDTTADMAASALYEQVAFDLRYSYYNGSAYLTTNKEVYIKATPNDDGSAQLISNANPFVQSLPDEDDGYIYIYLGHSYSTTNIELHPFHPVFWYKGGRIVPYTADYVEQHGVAQLKGLVIDAQTSGEGGYEGGEISLSAPGDPNYTHEANLDVYMNTFRIHSQGTVPFSVDLTNGYVYSNNTNRLAYTYEIPYYTSQLNNDAGFITSASLSGYATQDWVGQQGYSKFSGNYDDLSNKPTIPTVNNGTLTIQKNGSSKGTFTANQSGNSTINITTNADEITSGYFKNQIYINSHPENSPCIVPFLYNDLAFIRRRSGSYHAYTVASNADLTATTLTTVTDWTTTGLDNAFDGSPSYCTLNSTNLSLSDSVKLVIDIVCPQRFAYSNVFYIDFGAANWRAKNIEILVSDSDLPSKLYTSKLTKTGNSYGNYYGSVSYSFTNSGGSTVQGFNRLRIVLDHFNSYTTSSPRISQIGIINYGSSGVRNTYMSRGLDDGIYRNLNPSSNKGYSLGTSSLQWNAIYGGSIYENGTALSSKYLGISSKAADADKLDGQDSSYYLNYNNLSNKPTIPSGDSLVSDHDRTYWNSKSEFDGNYNSLSNKPTFATVATSGSYNDLSNKPTDYVPTSILQRDGGEIKTKFRCAQKGYTGSGNPVKYYKLCTLPVNDAGNYASVIISGRIGGWTSNDMSSISALVWNRGTPGFALLDIMAGETAESGAFNIGDLELFVESNNTASVYARVAGYFTFDLDIELYQSTATIAYTGNQVTPTGTSNCRASTSNKRMIIMNSKAYVNGNQLAFASDIPSLSGYATQSWVEAKGYSTFSGNYNDLSNKPTIPTGDSLVSTYDRSYWNSKSEFDGDYNSLSNKPTIPDVSGKLDKSGGTMTGDLFYKAMGSNPSSGAINGGFYFHNSNSANTSSYCFGLYQWGSVFQFTSRTKDSTPGGAYRATAFEINGNTGKTDFKQTPTVNGTNVALTTQIPTVPTNYVTNDTNQTVGGSKTFSNDIIMASQKTIKFAAIPGNATSMSNYVLVPKDNNGTNGIAYLKFAIDDTAPGGQSPSQSGVNKTPSAANYTGFHYVKSSSTSGNDMNPFYSLHTSNNDFRILTTAFSTSWYQQIATDFRSDNIYFRRCENGTLQSWKRIAWASEIPSLSGYATQSWVNSQSFVIGDSNVANIVVLTQAQYNALSTKSSTTLYLIRE